MLKKKDTILTTKEQDQSINFLHRAFSKSLVSIKIVAPEKANAVKESGKSEINKGLIQEGFTDPEDKYSDDHVIDREYAKININPIIELVQPATLSHKKKFYKLPSRIVYNNKNIRPMNQTLHNHKNDIQKFLFRFNRYDRIDNYIFRVQKKEQSNKILKRISQDTKRTIDKTKNHVAKKKEKI